MAMVKRLLAALAAAIVLASQVTPGIALAGVLTLLHAGTSGICLWNPSMLGTQPRWVFDASGWTFSGSNFSSGTNTGTAGGSIVADSGTVTSTTLNSIQVASFGGAANLKITSQSWAGGDVYVLGVIRATSNASEGTVITQGWFSTSAWIFYARLSASGTGPTRAAGDYAAWGNGFGGGSSTTAVASQPFADGNWHVFYARIGTTNSLEVDGLAVTLTANTTNTITTQTGIDVRLGLGGGGEFYNGQMAIVDVLPALTTTDRQKWEAYEGFRYNITINPANPYAGSNPPC